MPALFLISSTILNPLLVLFSLSSSWNSVHFQLIFFYFNYSSLFFHCEINYELIKLSSLAGINAFPHSFKVTELIAMWLQSLCREGNKHLSLLWWVALAGLCGMAILFPRVKVFQTERIEGGAAEWDAQGKDPVWGEKDRRLTVFKKKKKPKTVVIVVSLLTWPS